MISAVHPGTHFQSECESKSLPINFSPEIREQDKKPEGFSTIVQCDTQRRRHLKVVGTHIDVAFNRVDILRQLDKRTLERMASNPGTPIVVLERLAAHPIGDVRAAVADNEDAPLYTIWALSKDADPDVRYQLAENHNLPITLIRSMMNDENPYVACRAQQTYERIQSD